MKRAGWVALTLLPCAAHAQAPPVGTLPQVEVVGASPLLGSGVDRAKVPGATNVIGSGEVNRTGVPQAVQALEDNVPGANVSNAAGNPFQQGVFYHGFQASPLQGVAQGLAVYVNGVRFNQAFGDTVHWDLIPDVAVDQMNLVGANPVFGLNALGGAISVQLKNGFTWQGTEASAYGGSFGQVGANVQFGRSSGTTATYIAASVQHQNGWRDEQSSDVYQVHGDIGWRSDRAELHLTVTAADTQLNGPGTTPVQLLSADRSAQFTAPNATATKYALVSLNGNWDVTDETALQAVAYYSYFQQRVANGNATQYAPCAADATVLCDGAGTVATAQGGAPIADFLSNGAYGQLDRQTTNTNGYGVSLQATNRSPLFGLPNQVVAGASYDGAQTGFTASSALGSLALDTRVFVGPGVVIDQSDGSIAPVRATVGNAYYGLFLTDTLSLTRTLALTLAGRFNSAQIGLTDRNGTALNGVHAYNRFNPSAGITWAVLPQVTVYAGYSESNRAPTAMELSCASIETSCSLANFFVGDPNLKQVVARTVEAGLRGSMPGIAGGRLDWTAGLYRTALTDDIAFVNSTVQGRAYFTNIGATRRQGADIGVRMTTPRLTAWANFAYVDATFRTGFIETSEDNPASNAEGTIAVRTGNRMPGIPPYQFKLGADFKVTEAWTIGANGIVYSGQFLFGDEANLTRRLPASFVLNLTTRYQVTPTVQLFANVANVTNAYYYTYGTFSPTTLVPILQASGATDTRSYSPAAPVSAYGGVRVTF